MRKKDKDFSQHKKLKKLYNIHISESIVARNIRTEDHLFVKAHEQSTDGKKDLKKIILIKSPTVCYRNKKLKKLSVQTKGRKKDKNVIIRHFFAKECVENCFVS